MYKSLHKLLKVSRMALIYRKLLLINIPPEFRPVYLRNRSLLITWVGWGSLDFKEKKRGISRNREPKVGDQRKTLETFRGGTTQICLENEDMVPRGDRESHQMLLGGITSVK